MRVPNISLYSISKSQLNKVTNDLRDANEVVSTQAQINRVSDDPIGFSQVLDLRLSVDNLIQLDRNIDMGMTWIDATESALTGIRDELEAAMRLANKTASAVPMNAAQRKDAMASVQGYLNQILSLGNIQVNGSYVFSGTKSNVRPFTYDDEADPANVIYHGNQTAFFIKTGSESTLEVGRVGDQTFTEKEIVVDGTNNKIFFREDPGIGINSRRTLEGTIPDGTYSPEELAVVVRNTMNRASKEHGYGINYELEYDSAAEQYSIGIDGKHDGYMGFEMLWRSGEGPRVGSVNTEGILKEGVDIKVIDDKTLIHDTPEPPGTAPLRLTWDGEGKWKVLNDPGYGLPIEIEGSDRNISLDLDQNGIADITIALDEAADSGDFVEFDIIAESDAHSIGPDLGFKSGDVSFTPARSQSEITLKKIDHTNNVIDFREDGPSGLSAQLSAAIPTGDYTDMDELAKAVETAMETASVNNVDYKVTYSEQTHKFTIEDPAGTLTELRLLWNSGTHAATGAAAQLGYDAVDDVGAVSHVSDNAVPLFTITAGVNDAIDFKEVLKGSSGSDTSQLTATIPAGNYYDIESFARAVEDALEDESRQNGNRVDYEVTYSYINHTFTIREDGEAGKKLEEFQLLWETGSHTASSAAGVMGFDVSDVSTAPVKGEAVTWGIFETLFDFKNYLETNDVDGISRTITRLHNHYQSILSVLSDVGIKSNRLTVRKEVSAETVLTMKERKSMIEDADLVESIMNLQAVQNAYEASLGATSKIINLSLVDYL